MNVTRVSIENLTPKSVDILKYLKKKLKIQEYHYNFIKKITIYF